MISLGIGPVELFFAFALDMAIGDPRWLPHPIVGIGRLITLAEKKRGGWFDGRLGGVALAAGIVAIAACFAYAVILILRNLPAGWPRILGIATYIYLLSSTLALRGLTDSIRAVLEAQDLKAKRKTVGQIVGRDTSSLDEEGVRRAALESLAENASDGVIAPLFYLALGGLPLAFAYKAANTLDSMVGYKNDKYREFGWASARLDDILNYIPARITALLMAFASLPIMGVNPKNALKCLGVIWRDGGKHTSPNAGVPEAAMAGALGVRLGGPSTYEGIMNNKPYINEQGHPVGEEDLQRGIALVIVTALIGLALAAFYLLMQGGTS